MSEDFKKGDLVRLKPTDIIHVNNPKYPWLVCCVKGDLVTVKRESRKGKWYYERYHKDFLMKYEG
jgi:hypothetical protein